MGGAIASLILYVGLSWEWVFLVPAIIVFAVATIVLLFMVQRPIDIGLLTNDGIFHVCKKFLEITKIFRVWKNYKDFRLGKYPQKIPSY